jgi:outer membrane immunogenic protein
MAQLMTRPNMFKIFSFQYYSGVLGTQNVVTVYNEYSASKNLSYLGTLRGRLGYLAKPDLLLYVTGGMAYGGVSSSFFGAQNPSSGVITSNGPGTTNYSGTHLGWTAGAGLEWMFLGQLERKSRVYILLS